MAEGLFDLDFSGRDDGGVLLGVEGGEIHFDGAPALVAERSAFGLGGRDVADEFDGGGVGGSGAGVSALDAIDDGLQAEIAGERIAGLVVEAAHGCADLVVVEGGDVFHEEVEEAGIALEDGEELQRVSWVGWWGSGGGDGASGRWGESQVPLQFGGQNAVEQDSEERTEG